MRSSFWLVGLIGVLGCSGGDGGAATESNSGNNGGTSNPTAGSGTDQPRAGSAGNSGGTSSTSSSGTSSGSSNTAGASSASAGSGSANGGSVNGGGSAAGDKYADARTRCVERVNELRASKGKGAIPRLASAEPCADGQAKSDSESGKAHGAFDACLDQVKNWSGVAQNECPSYSSVEATLTNCIDQMWAEGPGGGHYDNIMSGSTHMACGFYTTPGGKVWMVQDFWTE